jgi:hypothetical protein
MPLASSSHLDYQPFDPHQPQIHSAPPVQIDRTDESGNVIGYSLITETESDSTVESYDIDHNLISSSYTNQHGYSQHSTWEVLLDATGAVAGQRYTSVSSDGSFSDQSVQLHDTEGNLLSRAYTSSDGSWEISKRVAPPDLSIGPAPLSHALQISGAWADGSPYQRSELYDINGNLVRSESVYGDGASELYTIEPVFNDDGTIQGYQGTWTWSDPDGEVSTWTNQLDEQLNFQSMSSTSFTNVEPQPAICTFPVVPDIVPWEPAHNESLDDWDGSGEQHHLSSDKEPLRIDRIDDSGNVIGYSLITETEWDSTVESYDLDHNLVNSSYSDQHGYTQTSTWETVLDSAGAVVGQRYTSVSSDGSTSDSWVGIHDTEGNLLSSTYSNSDGSWETTARVAPPDLSIGPAPLSHALRISGAWADGTSYERSELFDINGNLVHWETIYGDGSTELYTLAPVFNEEGDLQGYEGTWSWIDPHGEASSSSERFDSDLNPIWNQGPIYAKGQEHSEDGLYPLPVLYAEPHSNYAYRGISETNGLNESDQHVTSEAGDPLDAEYSELLTDTDGPTNDVTALNPTIAETTFSSDTAEDLAFASVAQPFITSEQVDLKLNIHSHRDVTHGMLLGGLDLALRGNKLDNVLVGNSGNNRVAGGRGKDLVTGGSGGDHFAFRIQRRSFDTITDFNAEEDKIELNGKGFRDLFSASGLRNAAIGSVLAFDETTRHLLFSPAGDGSSSRPIKLAVLPGLEAADFNADLFLLG